MTVILGMRIYDTRHEHCACPYWALTERAFRATSE
jgi:hypothetical protein